jgi:hypothetical protein
MPETTGTATLKQGNKLAVLAARQRTDRHVQSCRIPACAVRRARGQSASTPPGIDVQCEKSTLLYLELPLSRHKKRPFGMLARCGKLPHDASPAAKPNRNGYDSRSSLNLPFALEQRGSWS